LTKIAKVEVELVKKKNQLQKQLDQKTEQLIESERLSAIGEFSTRLAHDMRNPLSIIRMTIENFKALYGVNEEKQKNYDRLDHAINRMAHQVEGVLEYVQRTPLKKKKESLSKIITKALSPMTIHTNITIISPETDVMCNCDGMKMEIVFGNLLLNSIQAIEEKQGKIIIKTKELTDTITITIHDSGKGILEENIPKMYTPLFTTKQDGTGLGLPSVKNVVEQHEGTVSFRNNPTTFIITLPKS
jgi:signal transduction histidine kinase